MVETLLFFAVGFAIAQVCWWFCVWVRSWG